MTPGDWPDVERIYREGIATGLATFETQPPTWERFDEHRLPAPRLVATGERGEVVGWAAVTPVSTREVEEEGGRKGTRTPDLSRVKRAL